MRADDYSKITKKLTNGKIGTIPTKELEYWVQQPTNLTQLADAVKFEIQKRQIQDTIKWQKWVACGTGALAVVTFLLVGATISQVVVTLFSELNNPELDLEYEPILSISSATAEFVESSKFTGYRLWIDVENASRTPVYIRTDLIEPHEFNRVVLMSPSSRRTILVSQTDLKKGKKLVSEGRLVAVDNRLKEIRAYDFKVECLTILEREGAYHCTVPFFKLSKTEETNPGCFKV